MKLSEAILNPSTRIKAVGQLCDAMRDRGGNYGTTVLAIQRVFRVAGKPVPSAADVEEMFYEADVLESGGGL